MPYGYIGQNLVNQTVNNSGVFSISDIASLEKQGKLGGSLIKIASGNAQSVAYLDILSIAENKFSTHILVVKDARPATNDTNLLMQYFEDISGIQTLNTSGEYNQGNRYLNGTTAGFDTLTNNTSHWLGYNAGNTAPYAQQTITYIYNAGNSSTETYLWLHGNMMYRTVGSSMHHKFAGIFHRVSVVNGIRLKYNTGNIGNLDYILYGLKEV